MNIQLTLKKLMNFFNHSETFYIEFRIKGKLKDFSKRLMNELSSRYGLIGTNQKKKYVPHLTLIIPFETKYQNILLTQVAKTLEKHKPFKIKSNGFNNFNRPNKNVIYVDFNTPKEMLRLRNELARTLNNSLSDLKEKIRIRKSPDFHLTIAFKLGDRKFKKIKSYLRKKEIPENEIILDRVTILKRNKIFREIDLNNHKILTREEALRN